MTARIPAAVRAMPRRSVSRATAVLARTQWPSWLLTPLLKVYARAYGVDAGELVRPLSTYRSFLEFFTRPLPPGVRPQPNDPEVIVSPADGRIHHGGTLEAGALIPVKGVPYDAPTLLGDASAAAELEGGTFVVVYLAPGDYHRFHWPFDAQVSKIRHLPGDLWPVHPGALAALPSLFLQNERVVVRGRTRHDRAFAVVPVGALNVGSIRLSFDPLRTNRGAPAGPRERLVDVTAQRGDELGWFELGSAIVVILGPGAGGVSRMETGTRVRVGTPIGRLS